MMKRMHRKKLSVAVAQAVSAGIVVSLAAPAAYAQVTGGTYTITGSRIPTPNLESTSPITQITAQDIKFEHPASTENMLNNLPMVFADQGNMLSNGATGTANINLRGLGASRTLVLMNGRPLPPGTPQSGGEAADINQIPAPLIQRIEILTGGASAVYGSDAIAGVVNFIMNDRFEGVQVDAGYSFYNHKQHSFVKNIVEQSAASNTSGLDQYKVPGDVDSDGAVSDYSIIVGGNFAGGRGNATAFLGYHKENPVLQSQRDFSACSLVSDGDTFLCQGSSNSYPGKFTNLTAGGAFTIADAAGNVRPYKGTDAYNFGPFNYYQVPDERWNGNLFAHYDIDPRARVYLEFGFHDDHSPRQIAPSAAFGVPVTLFDNNPLLSQSFKDAMGITPTTPGSVLLQRRNIEGGPRADDIRNTSYRGVVGVKGEVWGGWDYDLYYVQGKVIYTDTYLNDLSLTKIARAVNVVTDPSTGQPACASALDGTDPNCVPWNIFQLGGVTQAATNYIDTPGLRNGFTERQVYGGTLGADLGMYGMTSPWAKTGVGVSVGAEAGVDKIKLDVDQEFASGDLAGQGGPTLAVNGQIQRRDIFGEIRVPIVEDRPGVQYLAVNGSYRYSDYTSLGKQSNTYGIGAEWNPVKEVKLRSSYQQAIRAPSIFELFLPQGRNLFNGQDPCAGPNPTATLAQCLRTGLPASLYGSSVLTPPAGQMNFLQGGNPNLDSEKAQTVTAGVVWQPMRNLSASVDYYKIKVSNAIANVPPSLSLSQCISVGVLCDLIHRDSLGTLWIPATGGFITATNVNIAKIETSGADVTADYTQPLPAGWGSGIAFSFLGTYLDTFKYDAGVGLGAYECAGFYGPTCTSDVSPTISPLAKWRHKLTTTWSTPWMGIDLSATWRHIDSVKLDLTSSDPQLAGDFNPVEAKLGERDYLDLAVSWPITKQFTIWAGVNNVFDRDPPLAGSSSGVAGTVNDNGNTFPQTYDALGRRFFATLTAKF
jgi:iron complex outermembrane recepter protein